MLRQRFPFSSTANLPVLSCLEHKPPPGRADADQALVKQVSDLSWLNVLRPHLARYVNLGAAYPSVNVTNLPPEWQADRMENSTKYDALKKEGKCLSIDSVLERGMRAISTDYKRNSLFFLPNYSGSMWFPPVNNFMLYALKEHLPTDFKLRNAVIPFAHDWGVCHQFEWSVYESRLTKMKPTRAVEESIGWSVMGDLNSNCYRPHQDVVIPSRTCQQEDLKELFGDMKKVKPSRQRKVFATFSGSVWDLVPICVAESSVHDLIICLLPMTYGYKASKAPGLDYLQTLNVTIFCPLPRGTTGWATRTIDVIYAGCIPVIFGDQTHHPFSTSLNWAEFSVTIDEAHVDRLEEILLDHSWEAIALMQANLMLVRDAFLYPSEGQMDDNHQRRGPFSFAMPETVLLGLTTYPEKDVYKAV